VISRHERLAVVRELERVRDSVAVDVAEAMAALTVTPLDEFAAVDEASAAPLLGTEADTVLAAGGMLEFYGDGGAGKTTLELDLIFHLAAGLEWLGLPVPGPLRVLVIENEGPRGKFRSNLRAKLAAWDGPSQDGRIHVLEDPWALFSFANEGHRQALKAAIMTHEIDVLAAAPVQRLGMEGGGTPDEVGAFMVSVELVRAQLGRPVALVLAHHENKAGDVAGAWEGVPDTLAHVQARGNGRTGLVWRKARWASSLHGTAWQLLWRPGEGFELEEAPEVTDEDVAEAILTAARELPGASSQELETAVPVRRERVRAVRDALVEGGRLVNLGRGNRHAFYAADDPALPTRPDPDECGASDPSAHGVSGCDPHSLARPALEGGEGGGTSDTTPPEGGKAEHGRCRRLGVEVSR
jgi:AAA domain